MKTGLTKAQKTTEIWFNEKEPTIHVRTLNTDLKKQLAAYAEKFPTECRMLDNDYELGCMEFEIAKGRLSFRLTEPYSDERRRRASEHAKKNGLKGRRICCQVLFMLRYSQSSPSSAKTP